MFGIMGCDASFVNAAGRGGKKGVERIVLKYSTEDPEIGGISCVGDITIISMRNGQVVKETYTNLHESAITVSSEANSNIIIAGQVTELLARYGTGPFYGTDTLIEVNASDATSLTKLYCLGCELTSISLPVSSVLADLNLRNSSHFTSLDLSNSHALQLLNLDSCAGLDSIDLSACTELTYLNAMNDSFTSLDLSHNSKLETVTLMWTSNLETLDMSTCSVLSSLSCNGCKKIKTIKYPATNSDVSSAVASTINLANAADGTVYTDSQGAYYSTIETAANNKGWTIEQLS